MRRCIVALVALAVMFGGKPPAHLLAQANDPGCQNATLVSTGGDFPRNPQTLAIRWTGFSNFELAYKGQVILLDAYFDRGSLSTIRGGDREPAARWRVDFSGTSGWPRSLPARPMRVTDRVVDDKLLSAVKDRLAAACTTMNGKAGRHIPAASR